MTSYPRLCCSFAGHASRVGVQYHNAAYRALGLDFTYVAFSINDIEAAVAAVRALNIRGCGVTMPFKEQIVPYLDRLDPRAAEMRSVNTVVNDDGILIGYNTDWLAAKMVLEEVTSLVGKEVVVLGAGGASRAIVYALVTSGARVRIFNRTLDKARKLADEFNLAGAYSLDDFQQVGKYDILIHTTSIGYRKPGETLVPPSLLRPDTLVMDIIAEPLETVLMTQARQIGARVIPGYRMRLLQAGEQIRLYTGYPPPLDVIEAALIAAT